MKKIKLGFTDTHDHLAAFFNHVLSMRYDVEIVKDAEPDFLIFGDRNFGTDNLNFDKDKVTKIFYTGENQRPEDYECHYAITFDHNYYPWHYRLPLFVIYLWALKNVHKSKYDKNYMLKPEIKKKTGFCSFVVKNSKPKERRIFYNKLTEYKKIDSGGALFKNIEGDLEGEVAKIEFLSSRKFNLCFESYSYPGYATEKILHSYLAGSVPIYWGSETIESDFNPKSMINVHNFAEYSDAIEYIKKIDESDGHYEWMVNQPKFTNNILPSYMFYNNFLNWFDSIVYQKQLAR